MPQLARPAVSNFFGPTKELARDHAPQFHAAVENICARMGIKEKLNIFTSPGNIPNAGGYLNLKSGGHDLFFTKGILEVTGMNSFREAPTPGMLGIIAHECSHVLDGKMHNTVGRFMPLVLGPAAGMAAVYLGSQLLQHPNRRHSMQDLDKAADALVKEHHDATAHLPEREREISREVNKRIITAGAYIAGAALGLVGGLAGTRHIVLAAERRADKAAVEFGCNAQVYADTLKKLYTNIDREYGKIVMRMSSIEPSETFQSALMRFVQRVKSYVRQEKVMLDNEVLGTHPTLRKRLQEMPGYEREAGRNRQDGSQLSI